MDTMDDERRHPTRAPDDAEPLAWDGRVGGSRKSLALGPVVLVIAVVATAVLTSTSTQPRPAVPSPPATSAAHDVPASTFHPPAPTVHRLAELTGPPRCVDLVASQCLRAAEAALTVVTGSTPVAAADVWSSLICGVPRDCPARLLDTGVPLGSVVLTFADDRRIAVNVIEPSSGADGDEPRAVVTSWNAGG
jgi:hypothetical protein